MADWLTRYGPPILAWVLFVFRRGSTDRDRRSVRWIFGGLAVSLTALTPAGHTVIRAATGVQELPRLIGNTAMLFAVWAALRFLVHLNGTPAGYRWQARWMAGMAVLMGVFFVLAPDLMFESPWAMEYYLAYALAQIPALVELIMLSGAYARIVGDPAIRIGLWLAAAGTTGALLYLVSKTVLAMSPRLGFDYPPGRDPLVATVFPAVSQALVLLGVALPAVAGWVSRYRRYRRLRPLWTDLYRADPEIALHPPRVAALGNLKLSLYRRVIEIRDGLLALQPYRDPEFAVAARESAQRAGLRGRRLEAEVEAAVVAAALSARARGAAPAEPEGLVSGGGDLASDTAFLSDVADAYRRKAPAVSTSATTAGPSR